MNKNFAHIAPGHILQQMTSRGLHHPYYVILAHDVANRRMDYEWMLSLPNDAIVILDNSLIELGHPAPKDVMQIAVETTRPNYITLPDHLGDAHETIKASAEAAEKWKFIPQVPFLGVVQGQTIDEVRSCVDAFVQIGVKAVAVPRVMVQYHGSRRPVIDEVVAFGNFELIHLYGFSDDIQDDFDSLHHHELVRGIDSAVPIRLGMHGMSFSEYVQEVPKRGTYWEDCNLDSTQITVNIWRANELARSA